MIDIVQQPLDKEVAIQAELSLRRLQPQLDRTWAELPSTEEDRRIFDDRLRQYFPRLFGLLYRLYGKHYDFFYYLQQIVNELAYAFIERPNDLRDIDAYRINHPDWHRSETLVGGALYVDLFSENLVNLRSHISYFESLGITYLHLMPLFAVRPGDNDGGYAISNYRSVDPKLGSMDDLKNLASDLHKAGIVLVLDLVLNHTADDHEWAKMASQAISNMSVIIVSFLIERCLICMNAICVRSFQPCDAETSRGMTVLENGFGQRSTAFSGI